MNEAVVSQSPKAFEPGELIIDLYSEHWYRVIKHTGGMSKLKNIRTGKVEDWNGYNNARFFSEAMLRKELT